jgi:hypothetical protein
MDLGAYVQIESLGKIAKENGIEVPRLRGYRLMKNEEPFDIKKIDKKEIALDCVKQLCCNKPFWNPNADMANFDCLTDYICDYFMVKNKDDDGHEKYTDVRWDRIHGWKRKVLKTYIHNEYMRQLRQWELWNKYAGKDDILYIHARIGSGSWTYDYNKEVVGKQWFLERVDDAYDNTYCDIYAKIKSQVESEE